VQGVTRKSPDKRLEHYWITLAKTIIHDGKKPIVGNADSWNTHAKPKHAGTIERVIGKHVFYVMRDM